MLPKIAIVGRPNVGKSALFNRICQKRLSIVDEAEGITRDRLYAKADLFGRPFLLIDTGGIDLSGEIPFAEEVKAQAEAAIREADAILFIVDGQVGPVPLEAELAKRLRKSDKPVIVAVNKIDQFEDGSQIASFQSLGIASVIGISALHGHQVAELLETALNHIAKGLESPMNKPVIQVIPDAIKVAIVGRPNVGKSTLLNQILLEQRSIVSPIAGTTRDAIDVPFEDNGQHYLLIDTAGIRRKKSEKAVVDKFAAIRTDEAIDRADVCLLVLDAFEGFTTQEKRIASEIEKKGKSCILLFNKWDLVQNLQMEHALRSIRESAPFLKHCPALFIEALTKRNVHQILPMVKKVAQQRFLRLPTGSLNKFIESCLQKYHPPLIWGKRLRLYYLTQAEINPPKFILFVNKPDLMTNSYKKFIINQLRKAFPFTGCPLFFELRGKKARSENC
ncbi:MAG TPA: ribosome biogenesis GTPase Der [Chlamydiales bacterium]|nr:ribosome biogenesis GTPase Der [Chlamydiales bacterium]